MKRLGLLALLSSLLVSSVVADPALVPTVLNVEPGAAYGSATRPFQGIPGIARTPGGRLWATWYGGGDDEGPDNYVMLASSADDGRTWSQVSVVADPAGPVRNYDPVVWVDPSGRLWWFYAQSYKWWDGRAGVWAVTTENGDNAKPTWSAPRRLADGIMMNKPAVLKNGDWLFPIAMWKEEPKTDLPPTDRKAVPPEQNKWRAENVGTHVYVSRDEGRTLTLRGTAQFPDLQFDEHMIVELRDGRLWLWARTKTGIGESFSTDGGATWTPGKESKIPHVNARFFVRRLRSGNLLLVKHNPTLDVAWLAPKGTKGAAQRRSHLTAYVSTDDGQTWRGGLLLDERMAVSYPDGDEAPDGRIFVVYDYNRKSDREIYVAAFTEADVLAGKLIDPRSRLRGLINQATGPAAP
jgi:hypothetical protein